jgi:gas vesicle protein GvpL/GvpF
MIFELPGDPKPSLLYVYAFVAWPGSDAPMPAGVRIVKLAGVCVAVNASAPPEPTLEALCAQHETVVRLAHLFEAVLPVRFHTALSRAELVRVVAGHKQTIVEGLEHVRGHAQMSLRLPGVLPRARSEPKASSGTEYLQAKGGCVTVPPSMRPLRDAVAALVADERVDVDPRLGTVLRHLVARRHVPVYVRRVRAAANERTGARLVITGPWPPFAFVPELW